MKEKRPTISPNFNFLGQLLDFEKKIKTPPASGATLNSCHHLEPNAEAPPQPEDPGLPALQEVPVGRAHALLEPLTLPCILADAPEEPLLARALSSLQLSERPEDSARLKRSFSLDIKSFGEAVGGPSHRPPGSSGGSGDAAEFYKPSAFKDGSGKPCQFSPVEEVSEQSTPERSPDKEEVDNPAPPPKAPPVAPAPSGVSKPPSEALNCSQRQQHCGSTEGGATSFLFGLSRSQQHLATPGPGGVLKGWHSDILLGPVTVSTSSLGGGWYLSSDSARFYSTSAILGGSGLMAYSCSHGLEAVRRRGRQRAGDPGDSRRSWHEESSFEKQLKRRSCQMEFGDGLTDGRSREEMGKVASQSSFSGSMEVIQVS